MLLDGPMASLYFCVESAPAVHVYLIAQTKRYFSSLLQLMKQGIFVSTQRCQRMQELMGIVYPSAFSKKIGNKRPKTFMSFRSPYIL